MTCVLRGSREMVVRNVPLVSKGTIVNNALECSREMVARNVYLVSKETTAIHVLMVTMVTPAVSDKQYLRQTRNETYLWCDTC